MAFTVGSSGSQTIFQTTFRNTLRPPQFASRKTLKVFAAKAGSKKSSAFKSGKFDSKNKRSSSTTLKEEDDDEVKGTVQIAGDEFNGIGAAAAGVVYDDGFVMPDLPGLQKDFWEGPEWDLFGFVVQYLWAFGVIFSLVACGVAVATYNEGATDFKKTPAYKESIQARDFLEEPEGSTSDVFESNPTEQAPSLE